MNKFLIVAILINALLVVLAVMIAIMKITNGPNSALFGIERTTAATSGLYWGIAAVLILDIFFIVYGAQPRN